MLKREKKKHLKDPEYWKFFPGSQVFVRLINIFYSVSIIIQNDNFLKTTRIFLILIVKLWHLSGSIMGWADQPNYIPKTPKTPINRQIIVWNTMASHVAWTVFFNKTVRLRIEKLPNYLRFHSIYPLSWSKSEEYHLLGGQCSK